MRPVSIHAGSWRYPGSSADANFVDSGGARTLAPSGAQDDLRGIDEGAKFRLLLGVSREVEEQSLLGWQVGPQHRDEFARPQPSGGHKIGCIRHAGAPLRELHHREAVVDRDAARRLDGEGRPVSLKLPAIDDASRLGVGTAVGPASEHSSLRARSCSRSPSSGTPERPAFRSTEP